MEVDYELLNIPFQEGLETLEIIEENDNSANESMEMWTVDEGSSQEVGEPSDEEIYEDDFEEWNSDEEQENYLDLVLKIYDIPHLFLLVCSYLTNYELKPLMFSIK
jgi:hypothetical protein